MNPFKQLVAAAAALTVLMLAACNDGDISDPAQGDAATNLGTVTIRDDGQPLHPSGDLADTLELEVFDADGNVIYGPVRTPLQAVNVFQGVPRPPQAALLQLDYLRNAGFLLFRAQIAHDGSTTFLDPNEQPADPHTTSWTVVPDGAGFSLQSELGGAELRGVAAREFVAPTKFKGVCYSPAPINFSNKDAPSIGDLFWDTFDVFENGKKVDTVFNWYALWGTGALGDTGFFARDDLSTIRGLGCNAIRIYSGIARQLKPNGDIPEPKSGQLFTHKQFLDLCWNNGHNPLYVLVDMPIADACVRKDVVPKAGEIEFWESNLEESVLQLKDHPAVIGFCIWNEKDAKTTTFPSPGTTNELTDYFYGQSAKYAKFIQDNAPGKLAGWALHDTVEFVPYASTTPANKPYMQQLKEAGFDFWGVNSYQTENLDSIIGNVAGNYVNVPDAMRLPVLFTELGWPATGHRDNSLDTFSIYEDATTRQNTADQVSKIYPLALESQHVLGTFYFEFQDEWWKQEMPGDPNFTSYNWNGRPSANPGFPNGFWDEEGFGLFSTARTPPRQNQENNFPGNGPKLPVDTLTERSEITKALKELYGK